MLRSLRIFYHRNKVEVWTVVGIIIFVYVIIRIINYNIGKNKEQEIEEANTIDNNIATVERNTDTYLSSSNSTIMSNANTSEEQAKNDKKVIDKFIEYCNNGDVESAYNMLSQDCKDKEFPDIDNFNERYLKEIFNESKSYDVKAWETDGENVVYSVKYYPNIMTTGKMNETYTEEYMTVVGNSDERKLNIKYFIGKKEINKTTNQDDIEINVTNKYEYYDYEQYDITVKNNGQSEITLDTKNETKSVYVVDDNGTTYTWFGSEIPTEHLTLQPGEERTYRIKFNELYISHKEDTKICFTDVHINGTDDKTKIEVDLQQ